VRRDESFEVDQHVVIHIDLPAGNILVRAGASGVVGVAIDASAPESMEVAQIGDDITIRAGRRSRSARIAVDAPVGSDVTIKGASVDVVARGALGALRLRTASGDVRADDLVRADVTLASGDARLDMVRHDAAITTTSGDITVGSVGGRLAGSLASGDLRADTVVGDVEVETASGDVTIQRCDGSSVAVRSVSGDVRLGLPAGIRVEPEISTLSGKVTLPDPGGRDPAGNDAGVVRRSVRVRLRTVSGDIRIHRA
jgi:DUF4097 and DUF4098 domain-containing protein YvlB